MQLPLLATFSVFYFPFFFATHSSSVPTVHVSHGLWLLCVFVYVCKSNQSKWAHEWSFFWGGGVLWHFPPPRPSLLYCRVVWFTVPCFFFLGRGDMYCNIVLIIWTVNCTEPHNCSLCWEFLLKKWFLISFSQTAENQIVQLQESIFPSALFFSCFFFFRAVIKKNP